MRSSDEVGEIKRLLGEISDLGALAATYCRKKKELKKLSGDIERLREERRSIDIAPLKEEIKGLETEYTQIFHRIDQLNVESRVCTTTKDLQHVLETVGSKKIHVSQCTEFMKRQITAFCLAGRTAESVFNLTEDAAGGLVCVQISKDLETLLSLATKHSLLDDMRGQFQLLFRNEIGRHVPCDFSPFVGDSSLFLVFRTSRPAATDPILAEQVRRSSFERILKAMPKTAGVILSVIKDNLSRRVADGGCSAADLERNNDVFKDTEFWIQNLDEWASDLAVRRVLTLSRTRTESMGMCKGLDSLAKTESGVYLSRQYASIRNCVGAIRPGQKDREKSALSGAIMKFFDSRPKTDIKDLFVAYSDITYQIKHDPEFVFIHTLQNNRESLFIEILGRAAAVDLDLDSSSLMAKARLKGAYCDFIENVDLFIDEGVKPFFTDQFFSTLSCNLLNFMLRPKKYTAEERECLADTVQYFLDLSFECRADRSEGLCKLEDMLFVVNSPMESVIASFSSGSIRLDKSEMRTAMRMFFEPGQARDQFLDSIY